MRVYLVVAACVLSLSVHASAADRANGGHHWLRRITWAAGCAASFWDAQTTVAAVQRGAVEGNALLVNRDGSPRWGRMISIKAGTCAGTYLLQTVTTRRGMPEWYWTAFNAGTTGVFAGAAIHNLTLPGRTPAAAEPAAPSPAR
jgi:hypothetical protein